VAQSDADELLVKRNCCKFGVSAQKKNLMRAYKTDHKLGTQEATGTYAMNSLPKHQAIKKKILMAGVLLLTAMESIRQKQFIQPDAWYWFAGGYQVLLPKGKYQACICQQGRIDTLLQKISIIQEDATIPELISHNYIGMVLYFPEVGRI
jgi:hypothetical protein